MLKKYCKIATATVTLLSIALVGCSKKADSHQLWEAPLTAKEAAKYDTELPLTESVALNTWKSNPIIGDESSFLYIIEEQEDGTHLFLPQDSEVILRPGKYQFLVFCHNTAQSQDDETDIARRVILDLGYPMRMTDGERGSITASLRGYANGAALDSCESSIPIVADGDLVIVMSAGIDEKTQDILPHLAVGDLLGHDLSSDATFASSFSNDQTVVEVTIGDVPSGLAESRIVLYGVDVMEAPPAGGVG